MKRLVSRRGREKRIAGGAIARSKIRRGSSVCLIALAQVLVNTSPVHATETTIELWGNRTAYIDITFQQPVTLLETETHFSYGGSYAGWLIHRIGEPFDSSDNNVAGGFVIKGLFPPHYDQSVINADFGLTFNPAMEPGNYRLYLLTDGVARVSIPADGLSQGLALRPKKRTRSYAAAAEMPLSVGSAGSVVGRFPVQTNLTTLSASMNFFFNRRGAVVNSFEACFTPRGTTCTNQPGTGWTGATFAVVPEEWGVGMVAFYDPGVLDEMFTPPYDGVQEFDGGGTVYSVRGGVIQVDIVE